MDHGLQARKEQDPRRFMLNLEQMMEPERATVPSSNRKKEISMNDPRVYIGADISKAEIVWDVCGKTRTCPNQAKTLRAFLETLRKQVPGAQIVCEATGGFERPLLEACAQQLMPVSLVLPTRVRYHALASGILAKTDAEDAKVISDFGRCRTPVPRAQPSQEQRELTALQERRDQVRATLVSERNRLEMAETEFVRKLVAAAIRRCEKEVETIDKQIALLIASKEEWARKQERMTQVAGVGKGTANALLAYLPELGTLNDQQVAALCGVAPYNHDSGKQTGDRGIYGGRPSVRKALYMAALSAARCNHILSSFYQSLLKRGKLKKVALVAVMRKLVILLNRMIKNPDFALAQKPAGAGLS
jgi:transposase